MSIGWSRRDSCKSHRGKKDKKRKILISNNFQTEGGEGGSVLAIHFEGKHPILK